MPGLPLGSEHIAMSRNKHGPSSHGAYFLMSETEIIVVTPRVCVWKEDPSLDSITKDDLGDRAGFLVKV